MTELATGGRAPLRAGVPRTHTFAYAMVLLGMVGVMNDVQGVALGPLVGTMAGELRLTPAQTSWALNAQAIAAILAVSTTARLADIFGHRRLLIPLMAIGTVGSVLAAVADGFAMICAGRAMIGFAIAAPMAWAMLKSKADAKGLQQGALMSGTVISICTPLALVLGGVLLEAGWAWSSVFWIIGALHAIMLVLAVLSPETPATHRSHMRPDYAGAVLLAAALVCLLIGITQGRTWGWDSARVLGLFAAAAVVFTAFTLHQRSIRFPMIDFRGMDKRQLLAGYGCFAAVSIVAGGLYIIVPAIGQAPKATGYGFGQDVLESSLPLLMILPTTFLASATSKPMLERLGPRPPMLMGGLLCVAAFVFGAFAHSAVWMLFVCVAVYGYGIVICFNVAWGLVAAAGRQDNMSLTFGMQYAVSGPAGALATAVVLVIQSSSTKAVPGVATPLATDGTYTANFLFLAIASVVLLAALGAFLVPRRLSQHGTATQFDGLGPTPPEEGLSVPAGRDTVGAPAH
jgi:MFS family permease